MQFGERQKKFVMSFVGEADEILSHRNQSSSREFWFTLRSTDRQVKVKLVKHV